MNFLLLVAVALVAYHFGKAKELKQVIAHSPGAETAHELAATPPTANTDKNAIPTGDVQTSTATP